MELGYVPNMFLHKDSFIIGTEIEIVFTLRPRIIFLYPRDVNVKN